MADGVIAFSVFSGRRGGIREGKLGKEDDRILPRVCFFWKYKYNYHATQGIMFTHRKTKWVSPQKTQSLVLVSTCWPSGWPLLKFALGVDSVKLNYGVSRSVHGPQTDHFEKPQNHVHFLADGRHVPARPQQWGVSRRLIASKLGNAVNIREPWIVPDKWIKHCGQTISLFTYQESTVLLIHCFCFSFLL